MTVIAQNVSVTYTSTGSVGPYAFNFPVSSDDSLTVIVNSAAISPALYIVKPVNNNLDNGGSVTFLTAPPAGQSVVIQRSTPLTQMSVFADNLPQPMKQFEDALDKLTEIVQELAANQSSGGVTTSVIAGTGISVSGTGTLSNPYVISLVIGFAINSFTGSQSGELGQQFVNPSFAASYSSTPTAASITNTDSIDSPFTLTTPFTSATLTGTFTHSAPATTTFTLNATNGSSNPTATLTFSWGERIFGGVGAPGATSSVTAAGTTAVLSTSDVLASIGVGAFVPIFPPYSPSGQCIYALLTGGAYKFKDAVTGFPFAMNTPTMVTFVNQYGVSLTMYLYQSTNILTGTFQLEVVP
jgi:hypothetical protein